MSLKQQAYEHIRRKLIEGVSPGIRLSPTMIAGELGVSQTPVREALSQLHSEGLVAQKPHRGMFTQETDRRELLEMVELRSVLEINATARAARRISDVDLYELEGITEVLHQLSGKLAQVDWQDARELLSQWMPVDARFHMIVLRAAGNRRVIKLLDDTYIMIRMFGYRTDYPDAWRGPSAFFTKNYEVHRNVFLALQQHDQKSAKRAMALHMRQARRNILARFDWLQRKSEPGSPLNEDFSDSLRSRIHDIQQKERL